MSDLKKRSSSLTISECSNGQNVKVVTSKVFQLVTTCRNCQMVYISDRKRIICPFCGSFYQEKSVDEFLRNNERAIQNKKFNQKLRYRTESASTNQISKQAKSESLSEDEDDDSEEDDNEEEDEKTKPKGVKNFFKNLINFTKLSKKQETKKQNDVQIVKNIVIVEKTDLKHRFLTVKNKNLDLFKDYRDNQSLKTVEELRFAWKKAVDSQKYDQLADYYCWIFSKSSNLIDLLVTDKASTKININEPKKHDASFYVTTNWKFMKEIYHYLLKMPKDVIDLTIKSISFCIVNDIKPMIDDLKVYLNRYLKLKSKPDDNLEEIQKFSFIDQQLVEVVHVLVIHLCNPLLDRTEFYTLYSIILCDISNLSNHLQNSLMFSLRRIPLNLFRDILKQLQNFLVSCVFPKMGTIQAKLATQWTSSAIKVMALLNCTNEMQIHYYQHHYIQYVDDAVQHFKKQQITDESSLVPSTVVSASSTSSSLFISYQEFYIKQLNTLDLYKDYLKWQKIGNTEFGFSFCQYPFVLSIEAKRKMLEQDSEQQMILIAKKSYLTHAKSRNELPTTMDLFLIIKVNRNNLVSDSMNEIAKKKADLKKKLRVTFIGEAAIDMGGVRKEWFLLLVRQIFSPLYGMFTYIKESNVHWFTTTVAHGMVAEYNLIGVLMGLAVYNGEILDLRFPPCVFKKLLASEVIPPLNDPNAAVGVVPSLSLYDLKYIMPDLASSLQYLLDYEGDVKEDFFMKFEVSVNEFDVVKSVPLKENGQNIDLTNENRKEYVDLYVDFLLNKSIYEQFKAFYYGFHSVCASNAVLLLRPEEIENLVCGSTESIDISELKKIAVYEGYNAEKDSIIIWFWEIIKDSFDSNQQKRLLLFTTGSDRIPIGGIKEMSFKISKIESKNQLPMSHTCFNQLVLPNYESKEILKNKLQIAIENAEGFGFK